MFHTHPNAEQKIPPSFAPFGEQSWHWIEFSLQIPYFYLSVTVEIAEGDTIGRHFLFSHQKDLLNVIVESRNDIKDLKIGLLSPGYMNGSNFYQFGQVKEIWESRDGLENKYVMCDGTIIYYPNDGNKRKKDKTHEMEMVYPL